MADRTETDLPWDALYEPGGEVPWDALQEFAAALQENPHILEKLGGVYDEERPTTQSHETYADLYVPAIIALAASDGDDISREELERWGQFLIDRLLQAGEHDDEIGMEAMSAACGNMGPAVLPRVLDTIDRIPSDHGAWFHLWRILQLAAESDDEEMRERVIQKCKEALNKVENGDLKPAYVMTTAWTLAYLERQECVPQLRRVAAVAPPLIGGGNDIAEAADYLEGKREDMPPPELYDNPVEDWLPSRVRAAKRWYRRKEEEDGGGEEDSAQAFDRQQEGGSTPRQKGPPLSGKGRTWAATIPVPAAAGRNTSTAAGNLVPGENPGRRLPLQARDSNLWKCFQK